MGTKPWFFTHVGRDMGKKCHFRGHNESDAFLQRLRAEIGRMTKARCKQTEIGIIPQDWHAERIGEHITLISGHHVLAQFCNSSGVGTPYLTGPADFPQGKIEQTKFTTKPTTLCSEGDILITVKGSGTGTMVVSDSVYCISRQLMAIRSRGCNATFLFYSLLQNADQIKAAAAGLIPGLSRSDILEQLIPLPKDEEEQRAIATALSDADDWIASLDRLIAKKRDIKQAAMQQFLTGKTRLPGFQKKQGYKQSDAGLIPADWDAMQLSSIGKFRNGINKSKEAFGSGFPFVNLMDVFGQPMIARTAELGLVETSASDRANYDLKAGDVLFIRSSVKPSGVGLTTLVANDLQDTVFSGFLLRFRDSGALQKDFKQYCFYEQRFRSSVLANSTFSANTNVNQEALKKLWLAVPSVEEQREIAAALACIDAETLALEAERDKARAIKQGMMQELLTGRIRLI